MDVPLHLMPPGYGPITHESIAAPHKLRHEENINRQVQLCSFLRSTGQPWSEAVLALRSLCIGLEDATFIQEWKAWKCHARPPEEEDGEPIWEPTNTDSAAAFAILMGLLSRWSMTFKKRTVSTTPALPGARPEQDLQVTLEDLEGVKPETAP